jgi:plastocyanin
LNQEKRDESKPLYLYFGLAAIIVAFIGGVLISNPSIVAGIGSGSAPYVPVVRHFTLIIKEHDIQEGPSEVWHAWTYNGTVPGPTMYANVGDTLEVKVYNQLGLIHSFHTHLDNYNFTSDGSQANVIVGLGAGAMIAPGQSYTYYLNATYAGIFYYHCHSADKYPVSYHIAQGLYGLIMVADPAHPVQVSHDYVVAMGELGPNTTGSGGAPYIMDGIGFPGGEGALMNLYATQGISGVEATFNQTLLAFQATVGQTIRFNVINVGEQVHSFHLHDAELISEWVNPGVPVPDAVVGLDPAEAESVFVTLTQPGVFLFHCHVVQHADLGMIGVLIVLNSNGQLPTAAPTTTSLTTSNSSALTLTTLTSSKVSQVQILSGASLNSTSNGFSPSTIHVVIGVNNTVMWTNNDGTPHTVTANDGSFDSGAITAGQSWTYTFTQPGTYQYHCSYHSWMTGTVIVEAAG